MQAPALNVGLLVAQALERDPQLDLEAEVGEPAPGLEHEVGTEVGRLALRSERREVAVSLLGSFDEGAVRLDAKRLTVNTSAWRASL
jgi:hypothetical protein